MIVCHTRALPMSTVKVAISLDEKILSEVDHLVARKVYPTRSRAIQEAVADKLARLSRRRLAQECAKLDRRFEQALAEESLGADRDAWPEY